jgi:hypothetical protein
MFPAASAAAASSATWTTHTSMTPYSMVRAPSIGKP